MAQTTKTARVYHTAQVHYLRKKITFADTGLAAGVVVGVLPANALAHTTSVKTVTAWNGTVSVAVSVGLTATGTDFINGTDVRTAAARVDTVVPIAKVLQAADVVVYASVAFGGTAGTAGETYVEVTYSVNNDL